MERNIKNKKTLNFNIIREVTTAIEHVTYYNEMSPFPIYDTEYVESLKQYLKKMKQEDKIDYDELPVAACKYCKSLHVEVDDVDNNLCMRCGSINEIKIYNTIDEYLKSN